MKEESAMRDLLQLAIEQAGSQTNFATRHDLSPSYVSDLINGHRKISAYIAHLLGYRQVIRYEPIPPDESRAA